MTDNNPEFPVGLTITKIEAMSEKEMKRNYWDTHYAPVILHLSDGSQLYATSDPEGNAPGVIVAATPEGEFFEFLASRY
jgi:hypothetical protein